MKKFFKNTGVVLLGIIIGMVINMGLIMLGGIIFETSQNFDPANVVDWDHKFFIFPFLAHSCGTLSGSYFVSKFTSSSSIFFPLIVGVYFLFGGIYMANLLAAPFWFEALDLCLCYIPMALLGWKISKFKSNQNLF